mmetsp:Transcript_46/g.92  ORF Transcript_46/g.92 Transcript_46/m.92 type:complete len:85 (+) Transcript_46:197-451(+)
MHSVRMRVSNVMFIFVLRHHPKLAEPICDLLRLTPPFGQICCVLPVVVDGMHIHSPLVQQPHHFEVAMIRRLQECCHPAPIAMG